MFISNPFFPQKQISYVSQIKSVSAESIFFKKAVFAVLGINLIRLALLKDLHIKSLSYVHS